MLSSARLSTRNAAISRATVVLLLVIITVLTFAAQHSDEWIKYTSTEGRYSVLLPSQPSLDSQEATTANGEVHSI